MLETAVDELDHGDIRDLADDFRRMRMDSIGRGAVLYFPEVVYDASEDPEDDEE